LGKTDRIKNKNFPAGHASSTLVSPLFKEINLEFYLGLLPSLLGEGLWVG
jgi:hypothetical protein